jgi:hypothetical protein
LSGYFRHVAILFKSAARLSACRAACPMSRGHRAVTPAQRQANSLALDSEKLQTFSDKIMRQFTVSRARSVPFERGAL